MKTLKGIRMILVSCMMLFAMTSYGRDFKFGFQTNLVQWANLGTANLEGSFGVSQHFSLHLGAKYNPWQFKVTNRMNEQKMDMYNNQISVNAGFRWWPWYVYSGWWLGAGVQYSDYANTGTVRPALHQGKAVGGTFSAGYNFMITKNFNIDLGLAGWAGRTFDRKLYTDPDKTDVREGWDRAFIGFNDIFLALVFVF